MILTGNEISKQVKKERLNIKPFLPKNVNPNSYNYRLGHDLIEILDQVIDPKKPCLQKKINFTNKGYLLIPGKLYLSSTLEEIGSNYYVTSLIGRSSVGRLGLFVQVTADLGQLGVKHKWTLELKVVQPLMVYPEMKIGQVTFWKPQGCKAIQYNGKYEKYSVAKSSELYREF